MNNIYDNGTCLLGTKKLIKEYCNKEIAHYTNVDDDIKESMEEILDEIKDFNDSDLLCINYDFGMGPSINYWTVEDKLEVK